MNAQEQKEFWYKNFTLKGRIFYPNLLKPSVNKNGRATFNTMFAFKKEENVEVMNALGEFLFQAKAHFHPSIPMQFFVNPLKNFDTYQRQDGKPNAAFLKGCYWVNAQSGESIPVPVVDASRQPVLSEAEVYSGRNAVVNISFYNIDKEKKGMGCNINAVMLLAGGDRETGSGSVDLGKIFGGFSEDMKLPPTPADSGSFI